MFPDIYTYSPLGRFHIVSILLSSILSDDPSDLPWVSISLVAHPQSMHVMSTLHPNCNKNNARSVLYLPHIPSLESPTTKLQTWSKSNKCAAANPLATCHTCPPLSGSSPFPSSPFLYCPSQLSTRHLGGNLNTRHDIGDFPLNHRQRSQRSATSASSPVSNATLETTSAGSNRCQSPASFWNSRPP